SSPRPAGTSGGAPRPRGSGCSPTGRGRSPCRSHRRASCSSRNGSTAPRAAPTSPRTGRRRRDSCHGSARPSAPLSDRRAEQLPLAQRGAALLAVDRERRAERRRAGGAAAQHGAAALPALVRDLGLELVEPPLRGPATETERHPVAQHLPAFLAQPVRGLAHGQTVARGEPPESLEFGPMAIAREAEPVGSLKEVRKAGLDREDLLAVYRNMVLTRGVEERGHILYRQGKIPGSFYTGRGNEA